MPVVLSAAKHLYIIGDVNLSVAKHLFLSHIMPSQCHFPLNDRYIEVVIGAADVEAIFI